MSFMHPGSEADATAPVGTKRGATALVDSEEDATAPVGTKRGATDAMETTPPPPKGYKHDSGVKWSSFIKHPKGPAQCPICKEWPYPDEEDRGISFCDGIQKKFINGWFETYTCSNYAEEWTKILFGRSQYEHKRNVPLMDFVKHKPNCKICSDEGEDECRDARMGYCRPIDYLCKYKDYEEEEIARWNRVEAVRQSLKRK